MNASDITSNSAVITWLSPDDQGTGGPVKYKIICNSCPDKTEYTGNETRSNFTLSNLGSYKKYNISVIAVNNVTEVIGKSNAEDIVFQTKLGGTFLFFFLNRPCIPTIISAISPPVIIKVVCYEG